jgi:hypothetical protein
MDKEEKSTGASKGAELLSADPKKTSTILKSVGIGLVALSLAVSTAALIVVLTMNKKSPVTHLVSFRNYDNALIATETIKDGEVATKPDITPSKPADSVNTYVFSGWDKEFTTTIKEDTTFNAQYTSTPIPVVTPTPTYTVRFLNDDTSKSVLYSCSITSGEKASYQGVTPTKDADSQYTYSFKGWDTDPSTVTITAAKDFTAQYNKTAIVVPATTYTVRFLNSDDSVLYSCLVKSGEKASYQGVTPTKTSDSQYTYAFKGWDVAPSTVTITENKDFKAQYNQTAIPLPGVTYYNVVFRNGSVAYNTQSVAEGGYASVPATNPTKASDENGSYSFTGWDHDPATTIINGYTEFNAVYNNTPIATYDVRFLNEDGTVLYTETIASGNKASYGSTVPTKASTVDASYKFAGWDKDISVAITANTDFKAQYDTYYQATFLNEDGAFVDRQEIKEGSHASTNVVPTKKNFEFTAYTFSTWKDKVTGTEASNLAISKNVTFVPTFTESQITTSGLTLTPDNATSPTYYSVTAYSGTDEYVLIPETASDGKPVTHISGDAFKANTSIVGIKGESITTIDEATSDYTGAFYKCEKLSDVILPQVVTIGKQAFRECSNLSEVSFPLATTIGNGAFSICSSLSTISMESVTTIGDEAFIGDESIQNILTFSDSCQAIGKRAFCSCSKLHDFVFLNPITIGESSFYNCSSLSFFTFISLTSAGEGAFYNCSSLTGIGISELQTISERMFQACSSLCVVNISSVTRICNGAFSEDYSLVSASFSLATTIDEMAFTRCTALQDVYLPEATTIASTAFSGCTSISRFTANIFSLAYDVLKDSTVASNFVSDSRTLTEVTANAFKNLTSFSYLNMKNGYLTKIGSYAFYNTNLYSLPYFNNTATSCEIDAFAFAKCTNLISIGLGAISALTVYEGAFAGIGYIDELTLPLSTTFNNSNTGDEYKISRYNPFLGDSFGSVTFAGTKDQFNAIQTRDAPKFGLTSLFPVGTIIACSDGNVTITV